MITVMALDRIDGWLFARDGERIRLLRPPYRLTEAEVVADSVVARAIMHHGYAACARELATWAEVVDFVQGEVSAQRRADGRALPGEGMGRMLLKTATVSMLERFLERIEDELLPREELDAAERILLAMQAESPRVQETSDLVRRTAALLERVRARRKERLRALVRDDNRFPRLAKAGKLEASRRWGERVAHAGTLFGH